MAIICPNCQGKRILWDDVDHCEATCFLCDGSGRVDSETFESVEGATMEHDGKMQQITRQAEVMANVAIADYYAKKFNEAIKTWERKAGRPLTFAEALAVGIRTMFTH